MPLEPSFTGLRARAVLADASRAAGELRDVSKSGNPDLYRLRWVAVVALIRAVGNVLKNVDGELSQIHREVISAKWQAQDKPAIYTSFIHQIRNLTLKEYRTGLIAVVDANTSPLTVLPDDADLSIAAANRRALEFRFKDGPFEGILIGEVIDKALRWWSEYLDEVEAEIECRMGESAP